MRFPYYEDGTFYLYYLRDYRNAEKYGTGVDWNLISTQDFVTYREHGTVIKRGSPTQQDNCVYTGGIVKDGNNLYHIFYTGHNAA